MSFRLFSSFFFLYNILSIYNVLNSLPAADDDDPVAGVQLPLLLLCCNCEIFHLLIELICNMGKDQPMDQLGRANA